MKRFEELHTKWRAMMAERKINVSYDEFLTIIDVADEHPKNPWVSVEERLPEEERKEDGSRKYYSKPVFVRYEKIWDGQTKPSIYYGTSFVFYTSDIPVWNSHDMREGQCTEHITHWMHIPLLE